MTEVEALRARVAELEAQIANRHDAVFHEATAEVLTRIQDRWRVPRTPAAILFHLWERRGGIATKAGLFDHLYGLDPNGGPEPKIIDVYICKLRKRIGVPVIETIWGQGYRLNPHGVHLLDAIIQPGRAAA